MFDEFLGRHQQPPNSKSGEQNFSIDQLLTGSGGLATGAAAGGIATLLLGGAKPKKLAKNALKVGGVALVGGLAYKAWRDWQNKKQPTTDQNEILEAPAHSPFTPTEDDERRALARALMRAMVSAAKADGHITEKERTHILAELDRLNIRTEDHAFIREELESPVDLDAIVRDARTPEIAAELYTASLLAIDTTGAAERGYLALLAARLRLDPDLVAHIHANTVEKPGLKPAA